MTPERARRLDIQAKEAIDQAEKLLNVATAALRLKKSEERSVMRKQGSK